MNGSQGFKKTRYNARVLPQNLRDHVSIESKEHHIKEFRYKNGN